VSHGIKRGQGVEDVGPSRWRTRDAPFARPRNRKPNGQGPCATTGCRAPAAAAARDDSGRTVVGDRESERPASTSTGETKQPSTSPTATARAPQSPAMPPAIVPATKRAVRASLRPTWQDRGAHYERPTPARPASSMRSPGHSGELGGFVSRHVPVSVTDDATRFQLAQRVGLRCAT